ncbi:hypothetical protein ZTR_10423 [Talaromyces verruculosus]|nr:hypothetical protein ZTR_10423 [Talaromyces verruculosus]
MFDFLYRGDYNDGTDYLDSTSTSSHGVAGEAIQIPEESPGEDSNCPDISSECLPTTWTRAHTNAKMYVIADKYAVDGLKDISKRKMRSNMEDEWSDTGLITLIEYVYGPDCPAGSDLCDPLLAVVIQHVPDLKESTRFHEALKNFPEFGYQFSTAMMERVIHLETELW